MEEVIKEIQISLKRGLTKTELFILKIAFLRGYSKGYEDATKEALKRFKNQYKTK